MRRNKKAADCGYFFGDSSSWEILYKIQESTDGQPGLILPHSHISAAQAIASTLLRAICPSPPADERPCFSRCNSMAADGAGTECSAAHAAADDGVRESRKSYPRHPNVPCRSCADDLQQQDTETYLYGALRSLSPSPYICSAPLSRRLLPCTRMSVLVLYDTRRFWEKLLIYVHFFLCGVVVRTYVRERKMM